MKKFYAVLVAAGMMVLFTACAGKETAGEVAEAPETVVQEEAEATVEEEKSEEAESPQEEASVPPKAGSLEELEVMVGKDVEESIGALTEEYEALITEVDSYEKYLESTETVEGFYAKVLAKTQALCIRMREHSIGYADVILASDKEHGEKYEDLEELYDVVYDEAGEDIYDEIYDGILDDLYDDFYNGILDEAYENAEYSEWSEARSNEYEWWADARSDVYDEWSDFRSEVYDFWSDLRGEMWDDDMEKAQEVVVDFKEDVEKLKEDVEEEAGAEAEADTDAETEAADKEDSDADLVGGMRPDFKEAMDSYEEFYAEYCEVLKQYMEDPTDMTVLTEYSDLMQQSIEVAEKFESWDNGDLNTEELKYYVEVNGRVTQMLVEASGQ